MDGGAVDDGFGGGVEQVAHASDFFRAPVAMVLLQGMAQVIHRFMDFRGTIMAAQRALADFNARTHLIQRHGLVLKR